MLMKKTLISILVLLFSTSADSQNQDEWLDDFLQITDTKEKISRLNSQEAPFQSIGELEKTLNIRQRPAAQQNKTINLSIGRNRFYSKVILPKNYDPDKQYPVIFFLHGLVRRAKPKISDAWWMALKDEAFGDYIQVHPAAWSKHRWWHESQVESIKALYQRINNQYNIDKSKVYLLGLSDGGSGSFFINSRIPDFFAATVSIIGNPQVISTKNNGVTEDTYPLNFGNRPYLVINTENDQLYPPEVVKDYIDYFKRLGADIDFKVIPGSHTIKAYKNNTASIIDFFNINSTKDFQEKIRFQTSRASPYNKFEWLIIDEVSEHSDDRLFKGLLGKKEPTGIAEARAYPEENTIVVNTFNIESIKVLIPHGIFDKEQDLKIYINNSLRYNDKFEEDVNVALKWLNSSATNLYYSDEITFEI